MKKPVALLLGLAALGVAGVETAAAQGLYYYGPGYYGQRYYVPGLAPWRIARIVRSAGMTPLSAPTRRGPVYEVVAIDPEGRHVRVAVDAYRGAITGVRPVAVLRPNSEPYGSRVAVAPPPEQDEMVPGSRLGPTPSQPGAGRVPPQVLPPYAGPRRPMHRLRRWPMRHTPCSHRRLLSRHRPRGLQMHPRSLARRRPSRASAHRSRVRARTLQQQPQSRRHQAGTRCRAVRRRDCSRRSAGSAAGAKPRAPERTSRCCCFRCSSFCFRQGCNSFRSCQHFAGHWQRLVSGGRQN